MAARSKYWNNITKIYEKQTNKGLNKYNMLLEDNKDMSVDERITMLEEELVDSLMYLEHLREIMNSDKDNKSDNKSDSIYSGMYIDRSRI